MITGLIAPTAGTIEVAGGRPAASGAELAGVGFVAEDAPSTPGCLSRTTCGWAPT